MFVIDRIKQVGYARLRQCPSRYRYNKSKKRHYLVGCGRVR